MKALVGAFNQEKALVGAFSVIVKTGCGTDRSFYSTTSYSDTPQRSRAPDNTNQYTHDIATTASDGHGDAGPGAEVELERQKIPTGESAVKLLGDCLLSQMVPPMVA